MDPQPLSVPRGGFLGLSAYHWLVIAAGWAGWGFDVFDAVLFNFVAPDCIPALLHLPRGSHAARQAAVFWTGAITSILLVTWALGGVLFGWVADRVGRKRENHGLSGGPLHARHAGRPSGRGAHRRAADTAAPGCPS